MVKTEPESSKDQPATKRIVLTNEENQIDKLKADNIVLKRKIAVLKSENKTLKIQNRCYQKNEFEVEKLLDDKYERNKHLFLVRWKNFDDNFNSWVQLENLSCPKILNEYLASKKTK